MSVSRVGEVVRPPRDGDEDLLRCLAAIARAHHESAQRLEREERRRR